MPNIKSAKKRVLVTAKQTANNKSFKSSLKTTLRNFDATLASGDKDAASAMYPSVQKEIDTAVTKGIYHKNKAARQKSKITTAINAMQ